MLSILRCAAHGSYLIEKYDKENYPIDQLDPIQLLKALMKEHKLKSKDLVKLLSLSKGTVSKMLNYQKGLSKSTIRRLANHFKLNQEAFNRPYKLKNTINKSFKNESLMKYREAVEKSIALHLASSEDDHGSFVTTSLAAKTLEVMKSEMFFTPKS